MIDKIATSDLPPAATDDPLFRVEVDPDPKPKPRPAPRSKGIDIDDPEAFAAYLADPLLGDGPRAYVIVGGRCVPGELLR